MVKQKKAQSMMWPCKCGESFGCYKSLKRHVDKSEKNGNLICKGSLRKRGGQIKECTEVLGKEKMQRNR